ncbi:MAG: hypothetical protein ACJA0J_002462, partial [Bdellovibrionota bacterium]
RLLYLGVLRVLRNFVELAVEVLAVGILALGVGHWHEGNN